MNESMKVSKRTKYSYSVASIGRDMLYTLYSTYLIIFITNALGVSDWELMAVGVVIAAVRVWDAINDPMMGLIIDNTRSKWGKFKPWILIGAATSALFVFLLFQDFGLKGVPFVVVFAIIYILLEIAYTINDISYWSMYPSFTTDQKERESIGSLARIFASLGMFIVVGLVPLIYPNFPGGPIKAFFWITLIIVIIFLLSQIIVLLGVKERKTKITNVIQEKTKLKDILKIIFKNDQLIVIIIAILLFNIGFFTTTALGIYYFDFDYNKYGGAEFTIFTVILASSQLLALAFFPKLAKRISRKKIFTFSIILISIGYLLFFSSGYLLPMNMIVIGVGGFMLFFGEGFIQVLVIVMLADTIEYGQWKIGSRNESIVFAINPFVTKLATSIQTIIVTTTLATSGINKYVINPLTEAKKTNPNLDNIEARRMISETMTDKMRFLLRSSMIIVPLLLLVFSYLVYLKFYKIDTNFYNKITSELLERIDIEESK